MQDVLPPHSLLIRKVWVSVMQLCACPIYSKNALVSSKEARIMQIDSSAALDRVNHQGILNELRSVGIGGSVLSILTPVLSNQSEHIIIIIKKDWKCKAGRGRLTP